MSEFLGILLASVPVILTLFGVVWKMSGLATTLTETIRAHKEDLTELRAKLAAVESIPLVLRDLEQIKENQAKMASEFPRFDRRLYKVEVKLGLSPLGVRPPSFHEIHVPTDEEKEGKR